MRIFCIVSPGKAYKCINAKQHSPKMYKSKFTAWNLDCKHIKREDGQEVLRQLASLACNVHSLPNKFTVRDRDLELKALQRYFKRSMGIDIILRFHRLLAAAKRSEEKPPFQLNIGVLDCFQRFFQALASWETLCFEKGICQVTETDMEFGSDDDYGRLVEVLHFANTSRIRTQVSTEGVVNTIRREMKGRLTRLVRSSNFRIVSWLCSWKPMQGMADDMPGLLRYCADEAIHEFGYGDVRVKTFEALAQAITEEFDWQDLSLRTNLCIFEAAESCVGAGNLALLDLPMILPHAKVGGFPLPELEKQVTEIMMNCEESALDYSNALLLYRIAGEVLIPSGRKAKGSELVGWLLGRLDSGESILAEWDKRSLYADGWDLLKIAEPRNANLEGRASTILHWVQDFMETSETSLEKVDQLSMCAQSLHGCGDNYSELVEDIWKLVYEECASLERSGAVEDDQEIGAADTLLSLPQPSATKQATKECRGEESAPTLLLHLLQENQDMECEVSFGWTSSIEDSEQAPPQLLDLDALTEQDMEL